MRTSAMLIPALLLVGAAIAPGTAQAGHNNGTQLCSQKFDGTFKHLGPLPLYPNGDPNATRMGRLSVNGQWRRQGRKYRVCAVTIRRWHEAPRWTVVSASRLNSSGTGAVFSRHDSGWFYQYAGPVVGGMFSGQKIQGAGQIQRRNGVAACASYSVTWPAGGPPWLGGGGCG